MVQSEISLSLGENQMTASSHTVIKHSITIKGHRTSVSLEEIFWIALGQIAEQNHVSVSRLIARIDADRGDANLSSALRVYVLENVMRRLRLRTH